MKCIKHPTYKGIYKPRVNCEECWRMYFSKKKKAKSSSKYCVPKSRIDSNTFPYLY